MTASIEFVGGLASESAGGGRPLVLLHPAAEDDGSVFFPETLMLADAPVSVAAFGRGCAGPGVRMVAADPCCGDPPGPPQGLAPAAARALDGSG